MNILFVYYNHNDHYTVIPNSLLLAFKRLGHKVTTCGRSNISAGAKKLDIHFEKSCVYLSEILGEKKIEPDLIFVCWPNNHFWIPDIDKSPYPTAVYNFDSQIPLVKMWLNGYCQLFDYIFCVQDDYAKYLKNRGFKNVKWYPPCCNPDIHKDLNLKRNIDLSFVGTISFYHNPRRSIYLFFLRKLFNLYQAQGVYFKKLAEVYSRSKIVFNIPMTNDINAKVFETMACGSLLITSSKHSGLNKLFTKNRHLIVYSNLLDAVKKISFFLKRPDLLAKIALDGKKEVLKKHTYQARTREMILFIKKNSLAGSQKHIKNYYSIAFSQYLLGSIDSTLLWLNSKFRLDSTSLLEKIMLLIITRVIKIGGKALQRKSLFLASKVSGLGVLAWQLLNF